MKPEIEQAIAELRAGFPAHPVEVDEEPAGGAFVIVNELPIGPRLAPATSWIGFTLGYQYPYSDVYPHFLRPDLSRADGGPLQAPLNAGSTMPGFNRPAVMLSRRSNRWNPARDTALHKLHRILIYLQREV